MKEKNLRCKFGKMETSNFGNENQEGNQEDMPVIRRDLCGYSSSCCWCTVYGNSSAEVADLRRLRQVHVITYS